MLQRNTLSMYVVLVFALGIMINFFPRSVYAQAEEECNEARLRDLSVAMINCVGDTPITSCGSGSLIGNTNAERVFNFFIGKGYQPHHAAGIIGNMMVESGIEPQRLQNTTPGTITPAEQAGNRNTGWGIVQWTPGSKFINPTIAVGQDPNDLGVQLEFLWNQLEGNPPLPERRAGDELKGTPNVEEAVKAFQGTRSAGGQYYGYERPADQSGSIPERTAFAIDALNQFGSGIGVSGSGSGCQLDASGCPSEPISPDQTVIVAGSIRVHPCIAPEVERMVALANQQGLNMSGDGYRDSDGQINTRRNNCGTSQYDIYEKPADECSPPTARPGSSRHERGTAVDFTCDGVTISSRSHPCFIFLGENTSLKNLPSEPWHWSIDGS